MRPNLRKPIEKEEGILKKFALKPVLWLCVLAA
jgi:hypothetical protein